MNKKEYNKQQSSIQILSLCSCLLLLYHGCCYLNLQNIKSQLRQTNMSSELFIYFFLSFFLFLFLILHLTLSQILYTIILYSFIYLYYISSLIILSNLSHRIYYVSNTFLLSSSQALLILYPYSIFVSNSIHSSMYTLI